MTSYLLPRQPQQGDVLEVILKETSSTRGIAMAALSTCLCCLSNTGATNNNGKLINVSLLEDDQGASPPLFQITVDPDSESMTILSQDGEPTDGSPNANFYNKGVAIQLEFKNESIRFQECMAPGETTWSHVADVTTYNNRYTAARYICLTGVDLRELKYQFAD